MISINSPISSNDKDRLINILSKYKQYFLSGTATTTVNTGEMPIRLKNDTPVYDSKTIQNVIR